MNNTNTTEVNEALQAAFNDFKTQTSEAEPAQPAGEEAQSETPAQPATETQPVQDNPSNQAFARMRTDNANMSNQIKAMEAALKTQGYTGIQDFLEKQKAAEIQSQAQAQGISPELEKRIQALEAENAKYRQNERMSSLNREVGALVQKYGITKEGWDGFITQLKDAGVNPLASNIPLETLYVQHNMEAIFNARLAKEKQSWMQEQQIVQQNVPINTPSGTTPPQTNPGQKIDWRDRAKNFKK